MDVNRFLIRRLNPRAEFKWLYYEATPAENPEDRMVRPGLTPGESAGVLEEAGACPLELYEGPAKRPDAGIYDGSFQHADAIDWSMKACKTRFLLLYDPDFFVIEPNWINQVLDHMKENKLFLFGSPYNPKWYERFRYFPCVHFMVIDFEKIKPKDLDFFPIMDGVNKALSKPLPTFKQKVKDQIRNILGPVKDYVEPFAINHRRNWIGHHEDVAYFVYKKYLHKVDYHQSCLMPVFDPSQHFRKSAPLPLIKLHEKFLPERLHYLPVKDSYSTNGFSSFGLEDMQAHGWEEYLWKGRPFAFHIRGVQKKNRDRVKEAEIAKRFSSQYCPN
jgi:hypothetical protein